MKKWKIRLESGKNILTERGENVLRELQPVEQPYSDTSEGGGPGRKHRPYIDAQASWLQAEEESAIILMALAIND